MRATTGMAAAMIGAGFLSACTPALLAPDDRKQMCAVRVDEMFGSPVFAPNPLSSPAGAVVGAAAGTLWALPYIVGPQPIILFPLGAVAGATAGAVCAAASLSHPYAEVKLQTIFTGAAPEQATAEVERALGKIGQRMAAEWLSPTGLPACKL